MEGEGYFLVCAFAFVELEDFTYAGKYSFEDVGLLVFEKTEFDVFPEIFMDY
jgi:hypothetical protein